jgi:hypothetical protein
MRIYRLVTAAASGVFMASVSTAAFAGCGGNIGCNPGVMAYEGVTSTTCVGPAPVVNCNPGVSVYGNFADPRANVSVYNLTPYGHLKTVQYQNTQNVNIMRVHSRAPFVALNDAPSAFTGGCTPTSTAYCRAPQGTPVKAALHRATAPAPAPIYVAPPPVAPRVTYGSGYNAANFASRQYGSTDFVPGIAHVPTSIVDRSPITHINGVPQPHIRSVTTANTSVVHSGHSYGAPTAMAGHNVIGSVVTGQYTYQPPGGGEMYWEKTSGPTIVDGLPATQIICRRQAPRPAPVNVRVVSPVIGVPTPVQAGCTPARYAHAPVKHSNSRYGASNSRWTH